MPGNESLREIFKAAIQRLQAIHADANTVTDLTTRLRLQQQIEALERALDAAMALREAPQEISQALRAPAEEIQTIQVDVDKQAVRVVLRPLGHADAEHELQAWNDICAAATECDTPGQTLRPMASSIGAVQVASTLVINSRQTRSQMRAAKALLQGLAAPAPLAWVWHKAREAPKQAATGAAVVVITVATVALALTGSLSNLYAKPEEHPRTEAAASPVPDPLGSSPTSATGPPTPDSSPDPDDKPPDRDDRHPPATTEPDSDQMTSAGKPSASRPVRSTTPSAEQEPPGQDDKDERSPSDSPRPGRSSAPPSPSTPPSKDSTSSQQTAQPSTAPTTPPASPTTPPAQPAGQDCDGLLSVELPPLLEVCL
ncbi:hypothetical protein [Nonomuraea sp. NPDC049646]|uniref:hypothetical protein n=1 Tax=unclassified Nonomuraea TaxID=2593643 RepID=UPI0037B2BF86